jgi:hypothetical protein
MRPPNVTKPRPPIPAMIHLNPNHRCETIRLLRRMHGRVVAPLPAMAVQQHAHLQQALYPPPPPAPLLPLGSCRAQL